MKRRLVQLIPENPGAVFWVMLFAAMAVLGLAFALTLCLLLERCLPVDFVQVVLPAILLISLLATVALRRMQLQQQQAMRAMQEHLRRSGTNENRALQAMRASHSALWDFDIASGRVYLSDGWAPFLDAGDGPTFTTLEALSLLVPEAERAGVREAIVTALKGQGETAYQMTHRVRKQDGSYIWVLSEGRVTERDAQGRALRMIGVNRDITELKQAEDRIREQVRQITQSNIQLTDANHMLELAHKQLLQSEKMATIGMLSAGIAHEINNPLGYVNSNIGTLGKYVTHLFNLLERFEEIEAMLPGDAPQLAALHKLKQEIRLPHLKRDMWDLLGETMQGLDQVKRIVRDLKDFSHADAVEQWTWADIRHGLESTLSVVWNELKYKCDVIKDYAELPQIYCLPSRLNQVFMNLLVNAAQAIEGRGTIHIRTVRQDKEVWVEIEDSGKGIAAEDIERIFDPFFTTKPVGEGTGLGLTISVSIVEKHKGRIEVSSKVNQGTTFRVCLPIRPEA